LARGALLSLGEIMTAKLLTAVLLVASSTAWAQTPAPETAATLTVALPTPTPTPAPASAPAPVAGTSTAAITDSIKVFGDFRYRHQSETQAPKQTREIERLQARLGVNAQIEENLKATLRLMTGTGATSGNQTLGDEKAPGMPRRNFGVDMAYFDYMAVKDLNFYGGKMAQPFIFAGKNQILLDRDITPEGLAAKYLVNLIEKELDFFAQAGAFWIRENYDDQFGEEKTDNMLNGGQLGLIWKPQDWMVTLGYGSFAFTGLKDIPPSNITANGKANGNTLDINGNYPTNFDIQQEFLEVKKKVGNVDVLAFFERLENIDADTMNNAHTYGLQIAYKAWAFTWAYEEIEKDAVVGLFTDSDFGGGVTSSRGQVLSVAYKFTKKVAMQYTVYSNENGLDVAPAKYDRSHLDLSMTF
jgi:putative porin